MTDPILVAIIGAVPFGLSVGALRPATVFAATRAAETGGPMSWLADGAGTPLADAVDPEDIRVTLDALLGREQVDVIAPCTDASVVEVWRNGALLKDAQILGGDRRSAALYVDKART